MFEIRRFTGEAEVYENLFHGSLPALVDFRKKMSTVEREKCYIAYLGDGTEGV